MSVGDENTEPVRSRVRLGRILIPIPGIQYSSGTVPGSIQSSTFFISGRTNIYECPGTRGVGRTGI